MPNDSLLMAELPLWLQLNKVSKKYMDLLAQRLEHLGIRRHYFLLVAIGEGKGELTQQHLADLLEVDKVAMVGILDSLSKSGFVRRTANRLDRRERLIVLTRKAETALPEIKRTIRDLNQRALAGLPAPFSAQFSSSLNIIKSELEALLESAREPRNETVPKRKPPRKKKPA